MNTYRRSRNFSTLTKGYFGNHHQYHPSTHSLFLQKNFFLVWIGSRHHKICLSSFYIKIKTQFVNFQKEFIVVRKPERVNIHMTEDKSLSY